MNRDMVKSTSLSKLIWGMMDSNKSYKIIRKIVVMRDSINLMMQDTTCVYITSQKEIT